MIAYSFLGFVGVGAIAAAANAGSRALFNLAVPFEVAVLLAFPVGLTTAFLLNRAFVFERGLGDVRRQYAKYAVVNLLALVLVWTVSVALYRGVFPAIGFDWHADLFAHLAGLASPMVLTFLASRHFVFDGLQEDGPLADGRLVRAAAVGGLGTLAAGGLVFLALPTLIGPFDEGIVLTGGLLVAAGDLPGRDFYAIYGPAQYLALGGLFALFEPSALVARAYDAALCALFVPVAWWTLAATVPAPARPASAIAAAILAALAFLVLYRSPLYPLVPATLLLLLGAPLAMRAALAPPSAAKVWPVAAVIAAVSTVRYDFGPIALLALGLPVLAAWTVALGRGETDARAYARAVLGGAGWVLLLVGAAVAAMLAAGILVPALREIVTYQTDNYVAARSLPFPGWDAFRHAPLPTATVYLPFAAMALGALVLAATARRLERRHWVGLLLLLSITAFSTTKMWVRPHPQQGLGAAIAATLLLTAAGLALRAALPESARALRRAMAAGIAAAGVGLGAIAALASASPARDVIGARLLAGRLPDTAPTLAPFTIEPERLAAARALAAETAPEERVLSATGRHDKIFVNNTTLYFAAGRLPATRWYSFDPGVATTEPVQRDILCALERHGVRMVVRDAAFDGVVEPNTSALSSGVTLLDDYLDRHFAPVARFETVSVLRRAEPQDGGGPPPCPSARD